MYGMHGGLGGGGFMFLFWLLLIIGIVWLFKERFDTQSENEHQLSTDTPLEILQKRYAAGEIDTEKYMEIKEELTKHGPK